MTWRAALEPLGFRAFRLLLAGRLADNLAHAIAPIALAFAVLDLGGTPSQLGLVLACRAVPTVLLVLFGGVIADRLPRHLVLVVANIGGPPPRLSSPSWSSAAPRRSGCWGRSRW